MGIGAENSANLYSCMGYFANNPSDAAEGVQGRVHGASTARRRRSWHDRRRLLLGAQPRQGAVRQGRRAPTAKKLTAASEGLSFDTASGRVTMHGRQVDKDMYLAQCKGTKFEVIKTIEGDQERHRLPGLMRRRDASPRLTGRLWSRSLVAQALNALFGIASLAILALGLAVVFGLLGVLNLAHGELVMIGAYCAYVVQAQGWPYRRRGAARRSWSAERSATWSSAGWCGRSTSGRSTRWS